jgi:dolichol kinase
MTRPPLQQTRYAAMERLLGSALLGRVRRSWRAGSLALLALLVGYFCAQNFIALLLIRLPGGRPAAVLMIVLVTEVLVRLRTRLARGEERPLAWVLIDNLRIGAIYAVVLEAFKLGT